MASSCLHRSGSDAHRTGTDRTTTFSSSLPTGTDWIRTGSDRTRAVSCPQTTVPWRTRSVFFRITTFPCRTRAGPCRPTTFPCRTMTFPHLPTSGPSTTRLLSCSTRSGASHPRGGIVNEPYEGAFRYTKSARPRRGSVDFVGRSPCAPPVRSSNRLLLPYGPRKSRFALTGPCRFLPRAPRGLARPHGSSRSDHRFINPRARFDLLPRRR